MGFFWGVAKIPYIFFGVLEIPDILLGERKMLGPSLGMRKKIDNVFLVDEGREESKYHYKPAIKGMPAKRHLRAIIGAPVKRHHKMAFRWHADDGPTLNAGLVAAIFQGIWNTLYFCGF